MYEVIMPSTGEKVLVRGLTLKEELAIHSTLLVDDRQLYSVSKVLSEKVYECVDGEKPKLEDWLLRISDTDLEPLLFGIFRETYGPELKISHVCETTKEPIEVTIDLDKVIIDGEVNTSGVDLYSPQEKLLGGDPPISIHYRKYPTLADRLFVQNLTGISLDTMSSSGVPKDSLLAIKYPTIFELKVGQRTFSRPSWKAERVQLANWVKTLENTLKDTPIRELKALNISNEIPYSLSFTYRIKCNKCNSPHTIPLSFFRHLLDAVVS